MHRFVLYADPCRLALCHGREDTLTEAVAFGKAPQSSAEGLCSFVEVQRFSEMSLAWYL